MKVFGKKRYKILPADSPILDGKKYQPTDLLKFLVDVDIYQGDILKAVIPAGSVITTRNEDHSMHHESFDSKSEIYIAIDEHLKSIHFPDGAEVAVEKREVSGGGAEPIELQDKTFTENGVYTADDGYDGFNKVIVDVVAELQDKIITENGTYTPDAGYDGFGSVTVDVASSGGGGVSGTGWVPFAEDGVTCTGEEVTIPAKGSYDLRFDYVNSDNDMLLITMNGVVFVAVKTEGAAYEYTVYGHDNFLVKGSSKGTATITTLNSETITCTLKIERYSAS